MNNKTVIHFQSFCFNNFSFVNNQFLNQNMQISYFHEKEKPPYDRILGNLF